MGAIRNVYISSLLSSRMLAQVILTTSVLFYQLRLQHLCTQLIANTWVPRYNDRQHDQISVTVSKEQQKIRELLWK
jgi:hypothetical protein